MSLQRDCEEALSIVNTFKVVAETIKIEYERPQLWEEVTVRHYPVRQKRKAWPGVAFGMALVVAGGSITVGHHTTTKAYSALSEEVIRSETPLVTDTKTHKDEDGSSIDWEALRCENADIAAWVTVHETDIDLPVLLPSDGSMSFYLTHDFWGNQAPEGAPFLDHRCEADDIHRMVYGHHLTMGGQFSNLQTAYEQEVFDTLGCCSWTTPTRDETTLQPFCSLKVDMWYEPIQQFDFDANGELNDWLRELASDSSARSHSWDELASSAQSVVTLVTCSSNLSGQQWRTLVLFVEVTDASAASKPASE